MRKTGSLAVEELNSDEFAKHILKLIAQAIVDKHDDKDEEILQLQLSGARFPGNQTYLDLALKHYLSLDEHSSHKTNLGSICLLLELQYSVTHSTTMETNNPITEAFLSDDINMERLNRAIAANPCLINLSDKYGTPMAQLLTLYAARPGEEEKLLPLVKLLLEHGAKPSFETYGIDFSLPANNDLQRLRLQAHMANTSSPRSQLDEGLPSMLAEQIILAITSANCELFSKVMHDLSEYYTNVCQTSYDPTVELQKALQDYQTSDGESLLDLAVKSYMSHTQKKRKQLHVVIQILHQQYEVPYEPIWPHPIMPEGIDSTSEDVANINDKLTQYPALVNIASTHGTVIVAALHAYNTTAASCASDAMSHEKQNSLNIIEALLTNDAVLPVVTSNPSFGEPSEIYTGKIRINLQETKHYALFQLTATAHYRRCLDTPPDHKFTKLINAILIPNHAKFNSEIARCMTDFLGSDALISALTSYQINDNTSLLDLALQKYTDVIHAGDKDNHKQITDIIRDLQQAIKVPQLTALKKDDHTIVHALRSGRTGLTTKQLRAIAEKHHALINIASEFGTPLTVAIDQYAPYKAIPDIAGGIQVEIINRIAVLLSCGANLPEFIYKGTTPHGIRTANNTIIFDDRNRILLNILARHHPYLCCLSGIQPPARRSRLHTIDEAKEDDDDDEVTLAFNPPQRDAVRTSKENHQVKSLGIATNFKARRIIKPLDTSKWPNAGTKTGLGL
ncbi:MAG: hypothetical protein P1U63_05165 [Coxiellaceae bacterium]|nr:hypothetical protein [Coxiellaceae bacterium]